MSGNLRVDATEHTATIRAARGEMLLVRICSLPCGVDASRIEKSRSGDLLRVRIAKKRQPVDAPRETPAPELPGGASTGCARKGSPLPASPPQ